MAEDGTSLQPGQAVSVPDPSPELLQRAAAVRRAAMALGQCSDRERQAAVLAMADALEADATTIVAANQADLEAAAGVGMLFHRQIDWALEQLGQMGVYALVLLGIALALFIAFKWRERRRFFKVLRMARISVADLYKMMEEGQSPVVVDVRSASAREIDPRRVPGSIPVDIRNLDAHLAQLPPDRDIIVYCT